MDTTLALLRDFAERYRLRLGRDELGDPIIPGRYGQLYPWDDAAICVMIFGARATVGVWRKRLRAGVGVGMAVIQHGDAEGTLRFDPADARQARAAIRAVGAYRRRVLSPEARAAAVAALERARSRRTSAQNALGTSIGP